MTGALLHPARQTIFNKRAEMVGRTDGVEATGASYKQACQCVILSYDAGYEGICSGLPGWILLFQSKEVHLSY